MCFWRNVYQSVLVPQTALPCPEKYLAAHLNSFIVLFARHFLLNVWQCSEYIPVSVTAQWFVQWNYAMYCPRRFQKSSIFINLFFSAISAAFSIIFTISKTYSSILRHYEGILRFIQAYSVPCVTSAYL